MADFTPITDELLARTRTDRTLRRRLVSEHLDRLMLVMSDARDLAATDSRTTEPVIGRHVPSKSTRRAPRLRPLHSTRKPL
jgi:hypothetical protein